MLRLDLVPLSRLLTLTLLIAMGAALGCGDGRVQRTGADAAMADGGAPDGGAAEDHPEVFSFDYAIDDTRDDFEADGALGGQLVEPRRDFQGVHLHAEARRAAVDYQVERDDGQWGDWQPVAFIPQSPGAFSGHVVLDRPAKRFRFRTNAPLSHVRLAFYEAAVAGPAEGAAEDDARAQQLRQQPLETRRQASSYRYSPPASVLRAFAPQEDAFAYSPAPYWGSTYYNPPNTPWCVANPRCGGGFMRGTRDLSDFLKARFPGVRSYGGYCCRPNTASSSRMSMHGTGRGVDLFVPEIRAGVANSELGDPVANYLITHARELGIQFIIWNRTKFNIEYGIDSYGGPHPHTDHLHVELTPRAASAARSTFPSPGAAGAPDADGDGLSDRREADLGTDPNRADTDGDGTGDRAEVDAGTDPLAPPFNPHFADDDGSIHEAAINAIYDAGITRGCAAGRAPRYCPDRAISRANTAVLLMRAFGLPRPPQDYFDDDDGTPAEPAINALMYRGISNGCSADSFCGERSVTRNELMLFIDRALRLPPTSDDAFDDDDGTDFEEAANRLAAQGLVRGCAARQLCGDRPVTRAELATILARARGLLDGYDRQPVDWVPHFADDDGSIHEDAINALYDRGITNGCGRDGDRPLYCPKDDLTRAQLAMMVDRAFTLPASSRDAFTDDDGHPAEAAIDALAAAGVTSGCSASQFCPDETVSLGQASVFLLGAAEWDGQRQWTQDAALAELLAENVVRRPCDPVTTCRSTPIDRAQGAALLARLLALVGPQADAYTYVRIRPVDASPPALDERVEGYELDAVVHQPASGGQPAGASAVVSAVDVVSPSHALGLPDNATCADRAATLAGLRRSGELVVRFPAPIERGDHLQVVQQNLDDLTCGPGGRSEVAVSADGVRWTVLRSDVTGNPIVLVDP